MKTFNPLRIKSDFPIFKNYPNLVYLDSASTSQRPQQVIDAVAEFYLKFNANIHRGIYKLSEEATKRYEDVRNKVAKFIGSENPKEIVFTKNTNESINLIAQGWGKQNLKKDQIVVLSEMEHHANIVPWLKLKEEIGIILYYLPITLDFRLDYKQIEKSVIDLSKVKLISLTHISNVLGTINPVSEIVTYFRKLGVKAKICIDGAQSAPNLAIDVKNLGCDFLVFSSHKILGPSGVGVLWAKSEILENMSPLLVGSHMISEVKKESFKWTVIPARFEVGTANLEGVYGLGAAIDYLTKVGTENVLNHEKRLAEYFLEEIKQVKNLKIFGPSTLENRSAIFSFGFKDLHPHDVAQILDEENIAVRSGHHCAQVLMNSLKKDATTRASLYIYNSAEDIKALIKGLIKVKKLFKV